MSQESHAPVRFAQRLTFRPSPVYSCDPMLFRAISLLLLVSCSQVPSKNAGPVESNSPAVETSKAMPQDPSMDSQSASNSPQEQNTVANQYNDLSPSEARVILSKGTDRPGDGGYTLTDDAGIYLCRQCNAKLYKAEDKFESHCGWPSFDDEVDGSVTNVPDADGHRVEIICTNCEGHLGHVFTGERLTPKNTRHCVNTSSMNFVPQGEPIPSKIVLSK